MRPDDAAIVASQLGREPRGRWRVVARCADDGPLAIAVAPALEDGSPFPTTFWLTCPLLVESVHTLESAGEGARFAERAGSDAEFAAALVAADAAYRQARGIEAGGDDPCASVGIAGQRDPLAVKCLHARLAAHLAGVPDPIGASVAALVGVPLPRGCSEPRCRAQSAPGC